MSVDLTKGATVELVKRLSDDIRTQADGTKAGSAGAAVRNQITDLKNAIYTFTDPNSDGNIVIVQGGI